MKRAVCAIPSGFMLRMYPVKHWIARFREFVRRSPREIVLPGVGYTGPNYDSSIHAYSSNVESNYLLPDWIRDAREILGEEGVIWVSIHPDFGFLNSEALWLHNQYDDDLPQACINKPVVQSVIHDFMDEISQLGGANGIALDVTDAYPNSGASGYEGVIAHCFCDFCTRDMKEKGFNEPQSVFAGKKGIQRLVLKIDEEDGGTAHIDPQQSWIDQRDVKSLVAFSIARQFVRDEETELERDAARLLKYLDARSKVTAGAIRSVMSKCKEKSLRAAVIMGSSSIDMCQMVNLATLDRVKAADEYWLPDAPDRSALAGEWQALQYLSSCATYAVNAFFETVEQANERAIRLGPRRFLELLLDRSKSLRGNRMGAGAAYVVDKLGQYSGFVGIPLGTEDHLAIITRLSTEVTGTVLPSELLDSFRIGNPDRSVNPRANGLRVNGVRPSS